MLVVFIELPLNCSHFSEFFLLSSVWAVSIFPSSTSLAYFSVLPNSVVNSFCCFFFFHFSYCIPQFRLVLFHILYFLIRIIIVFIITHSLVSVLITNPLNDLSGKLSLLN